MPIINNIGSLKNDLENNGWHMTAFQFNYNGVYDVLFENNEDFEKRKNPYASVTLTFIDTNSINRIYTIEANQVRMFFNAKDFREFFKIKYSDNLGDVFKQFFDKFVQIVPSKMPNTLSQRQNDEIDHCLASREGHNPNAIYCYDARRLGKRDGKQMHRSIFISNLTHRKKPDLFEYFKNESTVTFYYSDNSNDELTDIQIINKFIEREKNYRW